MKVGGRQTNAALWVRSFFYLPRTIYNDKFLYFLHDYYDNIYLIEE